MILFMILLITLLLLIPISSVRAERKTSVHLLATRRHHCREGRFRNGYHRL